MSPLGTSSSRCNSCVSEMQTIVSGLMIGVVASLLACRAQSGPARRGKSRRPRISPQLHSARLVGYREVSQLASLRRRGWPGGTGQEAVFGLRSQASGFRFDPIQRNDWLIPRPWINTSAMTSLWPAVIWLPTCFSTTSRPHLRDGDMRLVFMSRLHELYGHPEVPMERVFHRACRRRLSPARKPLPRTDTGRWRRAPRRADEEHEWHV
jgi:hypothetical protein